MGLFFSPCAWILEDGSKLGRAHCILRLLPLQRKRGVSTEHSVIPLYCTSKTRLITNWVFVLLPVFYYKQMCILLYPLISLRMLCISTYYKDMRGTKKYLELTLYFFFFYFVSIVSDCVSLVHSGTNVFTINRIAIYKVSL